MTCAPRAAPSCLPAGAVPDGWRLVVRDTVDSTQTEVRRALESGDDAVTVWPSGALVVQANEQTGGRGRHGRIWASPPGNLYLTAAIPCPEGPRRGVEIGFVGGVALARALMDQGIPGARLKWPNDLLLDGAKAAGLLPESFVDSSGRQWILLGMGVNVAHAPDPAQTLYPATALAGAPTGPEAEAEEGGGLTVSALLAALLGRLAEGLAVWRADGFAPVRAAWLRHGHGLGEPVRVRLGAQTIHGVFLGLAPDGALRLRESSSGRERTILAGDVFFPGGQDDGDMEG